MAFSTGLLGIPCQLRNEPCACKHEALPVAVIHPTGTITSQHTLLTIIDPS